MLNWKSYDIIARPVVGRWTNYYDLAVVFKDGSSMHVTMPKEEYDAQRSLLDLVEGGIITMNLAKKIWATMEEYGAYKYEEGWSDGTETADI